MAFFDGQEQSRRLFEALKEAVQALGPLELRVSKSQVALKRGSKTFAAAWMRPCT